jgi:hypothetical protein
VPVRLLAQEHVVCALLLDMRSTGGAIKDAPVMPTMTRRWLIQAAMVRRILWPECRWTNVPTIAVVP